MARRLKSKHLLDLAFVSDPALSPDGSRAAATTSRIVPAEGDAPPRYRSTISLFNVFTGEELPFTASEYADSAPRFSPDGRHLAFLSQRRAEGKPQLYLMPLAGGEPRRLSDHAAGVGAFVWRPDGGAIAYTSRGEWRDEGAARGAPRTIERLGYKSDGVGFVPTEPEGIYLRELEREKTTRLCDPAFSPSDLAFSPDGRRLYFTAAADLDEADAGQTTVWRLGVKSRKLKALLGGVMASNPVPSPDGRLLAFLAPSRPGDFSSPVGLWRMPESGGEAELLSGDEAIGAGVSGDSRYGRYPNAPRWSEDGGALIVNLNRAGRNALARIEPGGEVEALHDGDRAVTAFDRSAGRTLFVAESPERPGELFVRHDDGSEVRLSRANDAFVEAHRLATPEAVGFDGPGGPLGYWRLEPHKPRRDRALVLQVHGGPHANYGYGFTFEFQLLAAAGYSVIYGNPRGSSSFGSDFAQALLGAYGGVDADDVMAIAEHARAAHPEPEAPMHLTGGSYGGFMTNWLVGHSDAFRSAVTQRSICNWLSFYGTSDIGSRFAEREVGGAPWSDLERLWAQSPLKYVERVRTPTLVLHADADHRCPVEQAEQWFVALKRLGHAPTRLVRFPDEGHELSRSGRPDRRIARLDAIVDWFETHA